MSKGGSAMRKVMKPNTTQLEAVAFPVQSVQEELIDIFSVELPSYAKKYVEKKREDKIREILNMFDKTSLAKALEVLDREEIIKRMNSVLRKKGIKVKLRTKHLDIIRQILSEEG